MRLIDLLETAPIGAKVFHRSMGEGVTGVVTHKTEKDFVLELSNGHALVEPMASQDASWSLTLEKKRKKFCAVLLQDRSRIGDPWRLEFYEYASLDTLKFDRNVIRLEEKDVEVEVYE